MNKDNRMEVKLVREEMLAPLVDGHKIMINDNGTEADIIFFQIIPSTARDGEISGVPVSHLRLNMAQLDALVQNATNAKKDHLKRTAK